MTTPPDKPKRWRPRFSVRTLVVLVTLVCAYAACWKATSYRGKRDVSQYQLDREILPWDTTTIAPFLIQGEERAILQKTEVDGTVYFTRWGNVRQAYYFWFFGYVAKLPYEREAE